MSASTATSYNPADQMPGCTFADVETARESVYRHLYPTPLHEYAALSELIGAQIYVKHENHHAVGAFKVRGGVNLSSTLSDHEREVGLYTASTGNHGQSIAFAGKVTGTRVCVAMPDGANPSKVAAIRRLGAEVVFQGGDFDEAREWAQSAAASGGARFIGPTDPELIAGVGTYTLEIMESLPDVEVIIVPVGAGSGAASVSLVAKTINPKVRVIAVQAERAPAIHRSWKAGRPVEAEMETAAEGIATRVAQENALRMICHSKTGIDDFVLVSEDELVDAARLYLEHIRNVAELAGAAPLAAAIRYRDQLAGAKVVLVLSGGNISMEKLRGIIDRDA
ncbi:MAG: pyridoxal-phosphate dependent enzyme [Planctomycetes bacterium]|nr:pyridoxal-phosphate dependent enzyme [Planctomycetota bacterium]